MNVILDTAAGCQRNRCPMVLARHSSEATCSRHECRYINQPHAFVNTGVSVQLSGWGGTGFNEKGHSTGKDAVKIVGENEACSAGASGGTFEVSTNPANPHDSSSQVTELGPSDSTTAVLPRNLSQSTSPNGNAPNSNPKPNPNANIPNPTVIP